MWFRFVLAIAAIAMLGFVWMLFAPQHDMPAGPGGKPAVETSPGKI